VRQARLKAGLSMAQVAGSELTRQAVHLIETGKIRPSPRTLQVIARRLGVPAHSFHLTGDSAADLPHPEATDLERLCERQRHAEVVEVARGLLAAEDSSVHLQAYAHLYLGRALIHLASPDEALRHLRRARRLFEAEEDPWSAAEACEWEAGALHLKESPRAVAVAEEALRRYRALDEGRPEVEARMLEHLATCLVQRGDFFRAHHCYAEALHVAGSMLDLARLGRIYHGMGRCQISLGDRRRAIDLVSRAVALYAVENDLRPVAARIDLPRVENDLGMLLMLDGQLARAEELFESALAHLAESGVERLRSYLLLSLAELRQAQHRLDESLELVDEAIALAERMDERVAQATAWQQLGELRAERREPELADHAFERALAILGDAGMAASREKCLAAYHRVLEQRGDAERLERSAS
jgi:tetratricopeptide (TPR) repeat protein/DNA-binding XRE family transcriptional regulator